MESRKDAKYGELQWIVSENGAIRGWNKDNALEVTILPTLQSRQGELELQRLSGGRDAGQLRR